MFLALQITHWIFLAAAVVVAVLSVLAFVDCLRRPAANFSALGKLSKPAWLGMTAAACVVTLVGLAFGNSYSLFTLAAAVVAGVYLADVRPAVSGRNNTWY